MEVGEEMTKKTKHCRRAGDKIACYSELEGTENLPNYLLQDLVKKSSAAINERIYLHLRASM